jgi:hypothetical protein
MPQVRSRSIDDAKAVVEHGVVEGVMLCVEGIRAFLGLMAGKDAVFAPLIVPFGAAGDVDAAALDEVAGEADAGGFILEGAGAEAGPEQTEQTVERVLVAAVGCCRQKKKMTLGIIGEPPQQLEALLAALMGADAGVSLVHDDKARADPGEGFAASVRLDVVQAHHRIGMGIEQRL